MLLNFPASLSHLLSHREHCLSRTFFIIGWKKKQGTDRAAGA
jgi:hypothetical protein